MPFNDILLQIGAYPDPTPAAAIDQAVAFARASGSRLAALAVHVDLTRARDWVADQLLDMQGLCVEEEAKSLASAQAALADFSQKLRATGCQGETLLDKADPDRVGDLVARRARTRDLCLVPVAGRRDGQRSVAEAVVFGSGRPALVFQPGVADLPSQLGRAMIAWDGSRTAAHALAGALPFLAAFHRVTVVTVLNDKPGAGAGLAAELVRHLSVHGVAAAAQEVDAEGRATGDVLESAAVECGADLIVMGAWGRSRLREFVLGGATRHMLRDPMRPVLLAH